MKVTNAHNRIHYHHTGPLITSPVPLEQLPKPEFPERRFSKLGGDTVTFSESAITLVASIGKEPTNGMWENGYFAKN